MAKVSIIGLGWIGMPLAFRLEGEGYQVVGSKREADTVAAARMSGLACYCLSLMPELVCDPEDLPQLLNVDTLVITLPASRSVAEGEQYRQSVQMLVNSTRVYAVSRIIFLSSTSVYGSAPQCYSEASALQPITAAGRTLAELEQWLHALPMIKVDVLRLSGLVGPGRHPGRFLAGKKEIPGGQLGVNLVHQEDVLTAISLLLRHSPGGRVYNLCASRHPRKCDFYPLVTRQLDLPAPQFADEAPRQSDRVIDGSLICRELGMIYRYPDPLTMPFL